MWASPTRRIQGITSMVKCVWFIATNSFTSEANMWKISRVLAEWIEHIPLAVWGFSNKVPSRYVSAMPCSALALVGNSSPSLLSIVSSLETEFSLSGSDLLPVVELSLLLSPGLSAPSSSPLSCEGCHWGSLWISLIIKKKTLEIDELSNAWKLTKKFDNYYALQKWEGLTLVWSTSIFSIFWF